MQTLQPSQEGTLGDQFLSQRLLSEDQLRIAQIEQQKTGNRLETIVMDLGFISAQVISDFFSQRSQVETFSLQKTLVDLQAVSLLSREFCERHKVLLTSLEAEKAFVAMVDIHDVMALDAVRLQVGCPTLSPLVATETDLLKAWDLYYGYEMSIDPLLQNFHVSSWNSETPEKESASSPAVRLINAVILDAVKRNASDIHFEPEGFCLRIRYRLDGLLVLIRTLHISYWDALCVRLKIMGAMDIANSRFPQNGRFSLHVGARTVDFRLSSHPTVQGETLVVRILDKAHSLVPLEDLGYGQDNLSLIKRLLKTPSGLIVVTGPTGSGKTTSLYSMLTALNSSQVNIMTLEEPVEYKIPWMRQTEIREKDALTFARGVRSILRQDPDIILIGEIRDEETASMALRASMTGHQVFTTLHTQDVFGVIYRLQDLGLQPSLLAGNMICALGQRLIRKLCVLCKRPQEKNTTMIPEFSRIYEAVGCETCHGTGYSGRTAVVEILSFNETLNDLISTGSTRSDFKKIARENGFVSMVEHGLSLVEEGITSMKEFERVLGVHT